MSWVSLEEAVAVVQDGQTIAFGGMTNYRRPVAFVHALLRRDPRPKDLTLLCFTAGYESDLLVGAGCVKRVRSCYFGLESFGFAPMFTQAAQAGTIEIVEETELSIVLGIRAQLSGVGFMPSTAWVGTQLPELRPDVKTVTDPYSGETLTAFPPIHCDITVLHGIHGDIDGNITLNNNLGIDRELVFLGDTVIATIEEKVDVAPRSFELQPIPYPGVDYVVHHPGGASPTSCYPNYQVDGDEFMKYVQMCNAGRFDEYLDRVLCQSE